MMARQVDFSSFGHGGPVLPAPGLRGHARHRPAVASDPRWGHAEVPSGIVAADGESARSYRSSGKVVVARRSPRRSICVLPTVTSSWRQMFSVRTPVGDQRRRLLSLGLGARNHLHGLDDQRDSGSCFSIQYLMSSAVSGVTTPQGWLGEDLVVRLGRQAR
jgi:hypothetical protein